MTREWDDSVQVTLEAYREMVVQRDKFRLDVDRLKAYERAWMRLPVACRQGHNGDEGCGVEGCPNGPDCPA